MNIRHGMAKGMSIGCCDRTSILRHSPMFTRHPATRKTETLRIRGCVPASLTSCPLHFLSSAPGHGIYFLSLPRRWL